MVRYLVAFLALALGACTVTPPVEPEPTDWRDAAVKYYTSEERRKKLNDLRDYLAATVGQEMLDQRAPSVIVPYAPNSPLMREWVTFETVPQKGNPFVSFTAKRDPQNKVDLPHSQHFVTQKCSEHYAFHLADVPFVPIGRAEYEMVTLGPLSYHWSIALRGRTERTVGLYVMFRGGGEPPQGQPLQKGAGLYEIQDQAGNPVTKDVIKALDADFLDRVRGLDLSNSDCDSDG